MKPGPLPLQVHHQLLLYANRCLSRRHPANTLSQQRVMFNSVKMLSLQATAPPPPPPPARPPFLLPTAPPRLSATEQSLESLQVSPPARVPTRASRRRPASRIRPP